MVLHSLKFWGQGQNLALLGASMVGALALGSAAPAIAEEVCIRTTAGEVACGQLVPGSSSQSTSTQAQRVESYGFRFDLQNCTRNGNAVDCTLLITNTQNRDRELKLYSSQASGTGRAPSRAISTMGEEFSTRSYHLGNANSDGRWWKVSNNLVSGVPMRSSFTFEDVPYQTDQLAIVEIGFYPNDGSYRQVPGLTAQFRNVAIQPR
jgi:hypothetical protein